jgi:hypothetical protein
LNYKLTLADENGRVVNTWTIVPILEAGEHYGYPNRGNVLNSGGPLGEEIMISIVEDQERIEYDIRTAKGGPGVQSS